MLVIKGEKEIIRNISAQSHLMEQHPVDFHSGFFKFQWGQDQFQILSLSSKEEPAHRPDCFDLYNLGTGRMQELFAVSYFHISFKERHTFIGF